LHLRFVEALNFSIVNFSLDWEYLSRDTEAIELLEKKILPDYLKLCRWFGGKARRMAGISVDHILSFSSPGSSKTIFHFLILKARYRTGKAEDYLLPLSLVADAEGISGKGVIANTNHGWLIDAIYDEAFRKTIFTCLFHSEKIKQKNGALFFEKSTDAVSKTAVGLSESKDFSESFSSLVLDADQSNSSLIYSPLSISPEGGEVSPQGYFLKIYRKLFRETNPDVEMVKFLTEQAHFTHIPPYEGTFFWKKAYSAPTTFGMMQQKVTAVKDAWSLAGDYLNEFLFSLSEELIVIPLASIRQAELLGIRTAEMHQALAKAPSDETFAPEAFNDEYTDWLLGNCESLLKRRLRLTKDCYSTLDDAGKDLSKFFISNAARIKEYFSGIKKRSFQSLRIRIHGDYHLGQVLFDGNDYIILDFEGEPESSIKDRKIKHSPLKDVAGIIRSFHYAVSAKLYFSPESKIFPPEKIEAAVIAWYQKVTEVFLNSYRNTIGNNSVFQSDQSELDFLLQFHLLEKAVYELGYELNGRPTWVKIPLKGIQQVLKQIH
jgi:trehalose synthase-fused probable maltokinase